MREILFRGKHLYDGEWVTGYLEYFYSKDGTRKLHCYISIWGKEMHEVDPSTVGQFTGLMANGKRIFEGDIVHILGNQDVDDWKSVDYNALIAFLDGGFCAIDGTIEDHAFRRYALMRMDFELEVIGNIHDNPELMEVTPDE